MLADASGKYQPIEWAKIAIAAYRAHHADRIVAERNNGGAMVEATIRMVDTNVPVTTVWASRGKVARAEPVSALYEQGRIHHVGGFPALEDQMCGFTSDFDRQRAGYSPDRVDALVWAVADLLVEQMSNEGFYFWAKEKAASLQPKPAPRPEPIYAIGSQEYAAQQERLRLQRLEQGEDEGE